MSDGGKGSRQRPSQVNEETLAKNWEMIFGKKNKKEEDLEDLGSAGLYKPNRFGEVAPKVEGCGWHDDPECKEN